MSTVFNRKSILVHPTPYSSFVTFLKKCRLYVCDNYSLDNSRLLERLAAGAGPPEARLDAPPNGAGVHHTCLSSSSWSSLSPCAYSSANANAAKAHLLLVSALYCTDGTGQGSACKGMDRARARARRGLQGHNAGQGQGQAVTCIEVVALDSRPLLLALAVILIFLGPA